MTAALDIELPYLDNPFRPPDWRWLVAGEYRRTPGDPAVRRSVDAQVMDAWALQDELDLAPSPAARSAVLAAHGPMGEAVRLYTAGRADAGPFVDPALLVAELDGYLLAGLSDADAGREAGLPAATVAAYADLFFDVRGRLGCGSWISSMVIGPTYGGDSGSLYRALVRLYGYIRRSPAVVKGMARAADTTADAPDSLYDAVLEDAKVVLAIKAAVAARQVDLAGRMFRSVVEMQIRRMEVDRAAGEATGGSRKLADAMTVLLQERAVNGYNQAPSEALPQLALPDAAPQPR